MIEDAATWLAAYLNSKAAWFQWVGQTPIASGGYIRLKSQYLETTVLPKPGDEQARALGTLGQVCTDAARERFDIQSAVRCRILDLAPPERSKLTGKLNDWHKLDFAAFRKEVKRAFHADIQLRERDEWEGYLRDKATRVRELSDRIASAEHEIDRTVYGLFDLTPDEISLLETSLQGQY